MLTPVLHSVLEGMALAGERAGVGNAVDLITVVAIVPGRQPRDPTRKSQRRRTPIAWIPIVSLDACVTGNVFAQCEKGSSLGRSSAELISNCCRQPLGKTMSPVHRCRNIEEPVCVRETEQIRTVGTRALNSN